MEETQNNQSSAGSNVSNIGFPGATTPAPTNAPKKNLKWLIILVLFLVVIGGITFFVFKSSRSTGGDDLSATPDTSSLTNVATPEATTTPEASPSDKTQINIKVFNGTGIAGEAGFLADALKELGYTSVTTGNASDQNATETQVTFGSNVKEDVVTEITAKLKDLYTTVTTGNSSLPSGTDIEVVTGLKKGQTSAPKATAEPSATPTASPAQ